MNEISLNEFKNKVAALPQAVSVQGKIYHSIYISDNKVKFTRQGKIQEESIDLKELYQLYKSVPQPTNKEARDYISGRVQSPAVSIINTLSNSSKTVSQRNMSATTKKINSKEQKPSTISMEALSQNDESRFFKAFTEIVDESKLKSKSILKPVNSAHLFLTDNYLDYNFEAGINRNFSSILKALNSNLSFGSKSLAHFVDGLLINHPQLGTRIIEFDEEQHFTPALRDSLTMQTTIVKNAFTQTYFMQMEDLEYLNDEVLKKHRIKYRFSKYPKTFDQFVKSIEDETVSGYIKAKKGFPYVGGRIAQRAYYDCLRNTAHLSPKNSEFKPLLRFSKKYFEDASKMSFNQIPHKDLVSLIKHYLQEIYLEKI